MNNQIPVPPDHPTPGARGFPPGMNDLAEELDRMNIGQQRRPDAHPELRFAPGPGARSPPTYHGRQQSIPGTASEQYTLTKGKPNTFTVADRRKDPVDEADLRAKLNRIREKGIFGERQLNSKKMEGSKRNQVIKLIEDRNQMDLDPRFEWVVGSVEMLQEPKNPDACKSIRVILQRKPATLQRTARHPQQPFQWKTRIDLTSNEGAFRGRQDSIRDRGAAYREQLERDFNARAMQEEIMREQNLQENRRRQHERQLYEQHLQEQHAAAMRQGGRPDTPRPPINQGNGGGRAPEKAKPKASGQSPHGKKGSPVIQIPDDSDEESDSGNESEKSSRISGVFDSEAESSSSDTAGTVFSDSTRNSRDKAKKPSPKGTSRRQRSESPQSRRSSNNRRDRRGSNYTREHKRPVRDDSPPRKSKRESIYSHNDFVEIRPGPGPRRGRRDSELSGSSYNHWRPNTGPTYGGVRHERNHSFGLNKGLGNLGFEQKERIQDYGGSRHERNHSFGLNKDDGNLGFEQKERITGYGRPEYGRPEYGRRDYGRPIVEDDRDREHEEFLKKKKREVEEETLRVKQRENDLKMKELRDKERQMREKEWERERGFSRRDSPPRSRWEF